jgi:hypothetical protein
MKRQTDLGGDHFLLKAADPVGLCLNFEVSSTGGEVRCTSPSVHIKEHLSFVYMYASE